MSVNYTAKMLIRVLQVLIPQTEETGWTHMNEEASEREGGRTHGPMNVDDDNNNDNERDGDNKRAGW